VTTTTEVGPRALYKWLPTAPSLPPGGRTSLDGINAEKNLLWDK